MLNLIHSLTLIKITYTRWT